MALHKHIDKRMLSKQLFLLSRVLSSDGALPAGGEQHVQQGEGRLCGAVWAG